MSSDARPVVVIGGGIAGLAAAWQLAAHGLPSIVLEAEPLLGMHATSRNAAISNASIRSWMRSHPAAFCDVSGARRAVGVHLGAAFARTPRRSSSMRQQT